MGSGKVPALCSSSRQRSWRRPSNRPRAVGQRAECAEHLRRHAEQPGHAEPERGAVADHHGEADVAERGGGALQRSADPVRDHERGLAVRRVPARVFGRVPGADLGVGQALPAAAVPLPQVLVEDHVEPGQAGQRGGGARRAAQVRGDDHVRTQPGQQPGGALGLRLPGLVKRDVALPLEPAFGVPCRLAVPPQHEPHRVAQRVLPGLTTSSGSGIGGQSFQIRSRE